MDKVQTSDVAGVVSSHEGFGSGASLRGARRRQPLCRDSVLQQDGGAVERLGTPGRDSPPPQFGNTPRR